MMQTSSLLSGAAADPQRVVVVIMVLRVRDDEEAQSEQHRAGHCSGGRGRCHWDDFLLLVLAIVQSGN